MATWLQDIEQALANLGGVAKLSDIYSEVERVRPPPHPESIDAIIRGTIESHSSDSAKFNGNDIFFSASGLGKGVWGLRSYVPKSPVAADLGEKDQIKEEQGNYEPGRTKQEIYRILRDTSLARQIKALHKNSCQICGESIALIDGGAYSEAHHIRPLGGPHHGPDVAGNILVLCPNHHVMMDYGLLKLNVSEIRCHPQHLIDQVCVEYHNQHIYKKANNQLQRTQ